MFIKSVIKDISEAALAIVIAAASFLTANSADFIFQPNLIYLKPGDIEISNTQTSQAFYDELQGSPRVYLIDSDSDFELHLEFLVPMAANDKGRYSAYVYSVKNDGVTEQAAAIDGLLTDWTQYYEPFSREYYLQGPELNQQLSAGNYKIEVFSSDLNAEQKNTGKYVLVSGKDRAYSIANFLSLYWKLPILKSQFFGTAVWQLIFSSLMIAAVVAVGIFLVFLAVIWYFTGVIQTKIRQSKAKTILLTSGGMLMKSEISKLLQKPAYNITVAFIVTAGKTGEKTEYLKNDYFVMKEMGFNILEIDIEGKTEAQVRQLIEMRDIIFVEDGNAYLLLKAMRKCNFGKIMRELLKQGKVYLGVGSGSIVAGKTVKTALWLGQKNEDGIGNKGLELVPFDIFPHYTSEQDAIIKKHLPFRFQRKKIKFLTDKQAVLSQGGKAVVIGEGELVDIK
jgi:peptidase E